MSTSRAGTHRSELQDVTECPICCLRYERPLQLSCGHSFCAKCVDRLVEEARGVANRNFPQQGPGVAVPNIDQGINPPQFNRLDQDMWWGRPMMPPPPPGLGGLPPYPRYLLRNHNDEPPFFPRRLLGGNAPGDNIIRCPECRQPTRVPPEGLPVNYRLQEILSHVAEVNEQSNDQCIMDGTPLRKCLACDDVLSKGLYLLCRTCPGETVRQLCSLCCLRNHNGHDIEEKRFLTMQDVTVAKDVVSEAAGVAYHYVDLALNDLTTVNQTTRDLIELKTKALLQEFENIVNGLHFEMLSSNDELDSKVAAARGISNKLEMFPRLLKGLAEDFFKKATSTVDEFVDMVQRSINEGDRDFDINQLNMAADSNSSNQNDASCSGTSAPPRPHRPDVGVEELSVSGSGALQERRARQHRVMQQLFNSQRKRAAGTRARIQDRGRQGGYDPDRWTSYECDRFRDRFRGERLDGFLAGDEHHGKRRVHKMMQNLATEVRDQVDARSPVRPDEVKRSQSVEIIADTPPAVADLEQRAERLIISPRRRLLNRNEGATSTEQNDIQQVKLKCKHRLGMERDGNDEIDVVGDFMILDDTPSPTQSSSAHSKMKFGVSKPNMHDYYAPTECSKPGPSCSYVTFSNSDGNNSGSTGTSNNNYSSSRDGTADDEEGNIEAVDEIYLGSDC